MLSDNFSPYIYIWESEIQFICALASKSGFIETGGECYGYLSHAGRLVVLFVTPPGPNAVHEKAHFRQDLEFLNITNRLLTEYYGLNFIGTHHSHHGLGIEGLSPGDIQSTQAIARRNGYQRMCQMVVTFSNFDQISNLSDFRKGMIKKRERTKNAATIGNIQPVKLHTYFFEDAQNSLPIACPIKVLSGISPFREMIVTRTNIPHLKESYQYPMEKIQFDNLHRFKNHPQTAINLPVSITDGINALPEMIAKNVQLNLVQGWLIVSFPLIVDKSMLTLGYEAKPNFSLQAGSIITDAYRQDIMEVINGLGESKSLADIYHRALSIAQYSESNETPQKKKDKDTKHYEVSFGI
jgi:hypothetical protein